MLTRLREIVEKVAMAAGLPEALELLVKETCQAMHTDVCSIYLADKQRSCFYLMATKGLKKPRGRAVSLSFNEGVVGEVGRLSELILVLSTFLKLKKTISVLFLVFLLSTVANSLVY